MIEGKVFLVGAGPGDPGLMTVRGKALVESADAIVYDALANPALLPPDARESGRPELYYVGKRGASERGPRESVSQEEINTLIVKLAREGKRVVRLKGGDPFVFGRGSEEAQACNDATVPFEVVPGVTAGIAAPAYAGIPVTHRGLATSVTFVTGHEDPAKASTQTNWSALAQAGGTIVLYMGMKTLPGIARALIDGGMPAEIPAAAIQWGTLSKQRTVVATLGTLAAKAEEHGLTAPVITVIGWSVVLREEIRWVEQRPLFGKRAVVTRATQQASALTEKLRDAGADVMELPATRIARLDLSALRDAISRLADYQWLVFTSQNAVAIFWEQLLGGGRDARALAGIKVSAVGPATAGALLERGIAVDTIPERFVAEALLEIMTARDDVAGTRVLYVTAEGARDLLATGLRESGADVDVVQAYRSISDEAGARRLARAIENRKVDLVTFTSGSAVRAYVDAVGTDLASRIPGASIGPQTSDALRAAGIEVRYEAEESTIDGLVSAIVRGI
ncbi:MAG TPA: uroporphyrinogen-III C-methyltransferase [Gemmatimonadaceae bacterium]|nr:uroporphyrinogen-III C-methyltransferase [Gemmatimonadaceae bacterium]